MADMDDYDIRVEATMARRLITKLKELGVIGETTEADLLYPSMTAIKEAEEGGR